MTNKHSKRSEGRVTTHEICFAFTKQAFKQQWGKGDDTPNLEASALAWLFGPPGRGKDTAARCWPLAAKFQEKVQFERGSLLDAMLLIGIPGSKGRWDTWRSYWLRCQEDEIPSTQNPLLWSSFRLSTYALHWRCVTSSHDPLGWPSHYVEESKNAAKWFYQCYRRDFKVLKALNTYAVLFLFRSFWSVIRGFDLNFTVNLEAGWEGNSLRSVICNDRLKRATLQLLWSFEGHGRRWMINSNGWAK